LAKPLDNEDAVCINGLRGSEATLTYQKLLVSSLLLLQLLPAEQSSTGNFLELTQAPRSLNPCSFSNQPLAVKAVLLMGSLKEQIAFRADKLNFSAISAHT
jgi:hypothetical protein